MKRLFPLLTILCALSGARQGLPAAEPVEIPDGCSRHSHVFTTALTGANVVPPSTTSATGEGEFSLADDTLTYEIRLAPGLWHGTIHGPSQPGGNAPAIFDLGTALCVTTNLSDPGVCILRGSLVLSHDEVLELRAGLLYVDGVSEVDGNDQIRGQIFPARPIHFTGHFSGHNEVPPNNTRYRGVGLFTLEGSNLSYSIVLEVGILPMSGGIFGPARPNETSFNLVSTLDLSFALLIPPAGLPGEPGSPGEILYRGAIVLNDAALVELSRGHLYANIMTSQYPEGQVRAQIRPPGGGFRQSHDER